MNFEFLLPKYSVHTKLQILEIRTCFKFLRLNRFLFIGGINDQFQANRFLIFTFLVAGFYCNKNFIPKYLDNALKVLLKLREHRGDRIGEKSSCERFCKVPRAENHCWSKIGNERGESFRCYDNSDVIATLIITNFLPYLIQLWCQFFQILVYGDAVYAQTWEVLTLKNYIEPP